VLLVVTERCPVGCQLGRSNRCLMNHVSPVRFWSSTKTQEHRNFECAVQRCRDLRPTRSGCGSMVLPGEPITAIEGAAATVSSPTVDRR
jgi:hypothetical protein